MPRRSDPSPSTPATSADKLLDTAERLFEAHEFASVSMRKIALEAGCENNIAVQYHLGSKQDSSGQLF